MRTTVKYFSPWGKSTKLTVPKVRMGDLPGPSLVLVVRYHSVRLRSLHVPRSTSGLGPKPHHRRPPPLTTTVSVGSSNSPCLELHRFSSREPCESRTSLLPPSVYPPPLLSVLVSFHLRHPHPTLSYGRGLDSGGWSEDPPSVPLLSQRGPSLPPSRCQSLVRGTHLTGLVSPTRTRLWVWRTLDDWCHYGTCSPLLEFRHSSPSTSGRRERPFGNRETRGHERRFFHSTRLPTVP